MAVSLVVSAALAGMESLLNGLIHLDPAVAGKLARLSGKVLRVHCERPGLGIDVLVSDNRIVLRQFPDDDTGKADTTIRGTGAALAGLLVKRNTTNLKQDGITITGNTGLLVSLQDILQSLDIDWEYQLSHVLGDIPTQIVSDGVTRMEGFARSTRQNLQEDIDTYLHEEKKLFPAKTELDEFYKAIDALRLKADRLESRADRLVKKSN